MNVRKFIEHVIYLNEKTLLSHGVPPKRWWCIVVCLKGQISWRNLLYGETDRLDWSTAKVKKFLIYLFSLFTS